MSKKKDVSINEVPEESERKNLFEKGNKFWMKRSKHGRNPIFATPEMLWDACCEYFEWVEENPLNEEKVFSAADGIRYANVVKMRAMTIQGMCFFIGISTETWSQYKQKPDFTDIVREAEAVVYQQKFSGAAADLLNANIIARDLGLRDKTDTVISGNLGICGILAEVEEIEKPLVKRG